MTRISKANLDSGAEVGGPFSSVGAGVMELSAKWFYAGTPGASRRTQTATAWTRLPHDQSAPWSDCMPDRDPSGPSEDLFSPSVTAARGVQEAPYRAGSMIFPAFFGGPFAILPFAARNARRYGLSDAERRQVPVRIALCFLGCVLAAIALDRAGAPDRAVSLGLQVFGVLAYLWVSRLFRGPERRAEVAGADFDRIGFWRGLGAVLLFSVLEGIVLRIVLVLL
jgi:hypothetical protein